MQSLQITSRLCSYQRIYMLIIMGYLSLYLYFLSSSIPIYFQQRYNIKMVEENSFGEKMKIISDAKQSPFLHSKKGLFIFSTQLRLLLLLWKVFQQTINSRFQLGIFALQGCFRLIVNQDVGLQSLVFQILPVHILTAYLRNTIH